MIEDINILKAKFKEIRKMGWIKCDKNNFGTIGITFEKLIGVETNQFEIPDFYSIEIKTKSKSKYKQISLFNCVPTGPFYHEIERIKNSFGYPDSKLKRFKVFSGEVFCNKKAKIGRKYYFKLNVYENKKKITLSVYNIQNRKIEEQTYWDFDILEEKLNRKLTYLALISVDKKIINNTVLFKYNSINFYKSKGFNTFIELIKAGVIKINFKVGIFRDEKRLGKIHDRGTSFSIDEQNINKLFDYIG